MRESAGQLERAEESCLLAQECRPARRGRSDLHAAPLHALANLCLFEDLWTCGPREAAEETETETRTGAPPRPSPSRKSFELLFVEKPPGRSFCLLGAPQVRRPRSPRSRPPRSLRPPRALAAMGSSRSSPTKGFQKGKKRLRGAALPVGTRG